MSEATVQRDESPREEVHQDEHGQDKRAEVLCKRPREVQEHAEEQNAKRLQTDAVEFKYDASQGALARQKFAGKKLQSDADLFRASLSEVMQELARLRGHVDQSLEKMRAEMRLQEVKNEERSEDCRALERGLQALAGRVGDFHHAMKIRKDEGNEAAQTFCMGEAWDAL
jgi:hypothetical protein